MTPSAVPWRDHRVIRERLTRRRWLLPVAVLIVDAVLLFGAVVVGLRLPGLQGAASLPGSQGPNYATLHAAVHPLRPGFVAAALGGPAGAAIAPTVTTVAGSRPQSLTALLNTAQTGLGDVPVLSVGNNDDFGSAAPVATLPWAGRANTSGATRQPGEPGSCSPVGGTVWFRYDAPAAERLRASVSAGTSTALAAYEGRSLNGLRQVGCAVSPTGNPSVITDVAAGDTYFFQVDRPAGGPLVFHLEPQPSVSIASLDASGHVACPDVIGQVPDAGSCGKQGSFSVSISANGRWVAFHSDQPLVPAVKTRAHVTCTGNDCTDVYVRDMKRHRTLLASVSSRGVIGNDSSIVGYGPYGISADGRYVTFSSLASNLIPHDTNHCDLALLQHNKASADTSCADIFVHDVVSGQTERVSVSSRGEQADGASWAPSLSPDGRYVAFVSFATNLVAHSPTALCQTSDYYSDSNSPGAPPISPCPGIYLHDRVTGHTERVDVNPLGEGGATASNGATVPLAPAFIRLAISRGGRYVAFTTAADNLAAADTNGSNDVFVRDRRLHRTTMVSFDEHGHQFAKGAYAPSLTPDGRYVLFTAQPQQAATAPCTFFATQTGYCPRTYIRDLRRGITRPVDVAIDGGAPNDYGGWASATSDGRYVVFWSAADNLTDVDTNSRIDAQCQGGVPTYTAPGTGCTPADTFIRDMTKRPGTPGAITQVSLTPDGQQPHGESWLAVISPDGRYVAFESWAPIVPADTNFYGDVYLYDRGAPRVSSGRAQARAR
ncbi:MAG: hypothetical protein QOJ79_2581 [Actinomycetota bacterium]|jgi:Tol biopolymer transport system component|nr:hypothetical protein [Actinomycetota bacterium]